MFNILGFLRTFPDKKEEAEVSEKIDLFHESLWHLLYY